MREYATTTEVWPTNPPANADSLLTLASLLVEDATKTAFYQTDTDGYPASGAIRGLFRDATAAQAMFWADQGIDPARGPTGIKRQATSKSLGGASFSYESSGRNDQLEALTELCPLAYLLLDRVGLLNGQPVRT